MSFKYEIDKEFDYTIEEKGNAFVSLRKIKWGNSENFKLDLRKYYAGADGQETMSKGVSFTDEGAHELTKTLLDNNYGYADEIAEVVRKNRKDILSELIKSKDISLDNMDEIDEEYFDPRELIEDE